MKAFHVRVNGRVLCTAGVGEDGVVSVILTWVGGKPPRPAEGRLRLAVGETTPRVAIRLIGLHRI